MVLSNLRLNQNCSQGVFSSKHFTLWITLIVSLLCYEVNCQGEPQEIHKHIPSFASVSREPVSRFFLFLRFRFIEFKWAFFCAKYRDRKCFLGGRMDMAKTQVINLSGAQQPTYMYSGLVNRFWNHRTRKWDLELIIFIISSISEHANLETESFLWLIASH